MLSQPQLINLILHDLNTQDNTKAKSIPACLTKLLPKDLDEQEIKSDFHSCRAINKLCFLEKSVWPDISVVVHQCTRFQDSLKWSHIQAVQMIGHYLKGMRDNGIVLSPDQTRSFECWVDVDFAGNWLPEGAQKHPMTSKSCLGWIITYAGYPITWAS